MVNVKLYEFTGVVINAVTSDLNDIIDYVLPLFLEDRDNIGGGTGRNRDQEHLDRRRGGASIPFGVNSYGVSAGRRPEEKFVPGVFYDCFVK
jgi:hypothetical protein